jgi:putative CocE/NonD family hydrolase
MLIEKQPRPWRQSLLWLLVLLSWPLLAQDAQFPPRNEVFIDNHVPIPMRDGVVLYADVYRPVKSGTYPVIVGLTPYSTERHSTPVYDYVDAYKAPLFFARRGYVFVYEDIRGRYESEGKWEPFRNDIDDGYDTIEWAARQPWSNGKIGMQGMSYEGAVQWRAAMARPPHLVTITPNVASTSPYHDWVTLNGAWRLAFNVDWGAIRMESRITQNTGPNLEQGGPESISLARIFWDLPLNHMQSLLGRHGQFYQDWISHPDYDEYWRKVNAEEVFGQIGIPVLNFGGWFDLFLQGTLHGYMGMHQHGATQLAREKAHLLVGPWGHRPSRKLGTMDFGEAAVVDADIIVLQWFDYWLKGMDNGVGSQLPVRIFVMGRNEWREEREFPPPWTQYRNLYLRSNGHANSIRGDGELSWSAPGTETSVDQYIYDPDNPVSSGTQTEERNDVLVYTSSFLTRELEVTGPVKLLLYASSDCVDTDFTAKLTDVYPDGRSFHIAQGILRARYRESVSHPKPLVPGMIYPITIDLLATSNVFLPGHRIRLDITSSKFPAFDRNPNTGEPFGTSSKVRIAHQFVYHSKMYPAHIILPVIEGDGER